ncbi:hypothetical protein FPQ18DRAFT_342085 [Pyronema domesticum]|uniref:Uncharacterized protein n=1 Tax=Pyronema omphalodes (strain CBS 100304) TaxID=1076935 RepID=U4LJ05_PYROM|nr:hypothetical protein FPQ18DRAFT_342085 [Pyronema domesticum]CCX16724.1 Protein of unknown function [Pyronema omphalodes CBS 100304]
MAPITLPKKSAPKKAPKASRPTRTKNRTHTSAGVAKKPIKNDKRTPKQRAAELERLAKSLPVLNTVVPAGATGKVKGGHGKIGKVFTEDHDTDKLMRFIEQAAGKQEVGEESKLEKARKLEAIREARRREDEKKEEARKEKLDETKNKVRRKRNNKSGGAPESDDEKPVKKAGKDGKPKKKVGFA